MTASQPQWFLLSMKIDTTSQGGVDLPTCINKISNILYSYSDATRCVYKWKVTGEPKVIAVFEVTKVIGLERTLSGLARVGFVDVTSCQPLLEYEKKSDTVKIESEDIAEAASTNPLTDVKQLYWLEWTIENHGKRRDEQIWKEVAAGVLARDSVSVVEFYKVMAERKLHMFVDIPAVEMDALSFKLPVLQNNGDAVTIVSKGLQSLDDYLNHISSK